MRKEIACVDSIFNLFNPWGVLFEFLVILIHPSPFLQGNRVWLYSNHAQNMYFYHINDIFSILQSLKWMYISYLTIFQSELIELQDKVFSVFQEPNRNRELLKNIQQMHRTIFICHHCLTDNYLICH